MTRHALAGSRPEVSGLYGAGVFADSLSNYHAGKTWHERSAIAFIAPVTSTLVSVRWYKRGGTASYGAGTGGDIRVSIQSVDAAGKPTGTILASYTHTAIGNTTAPADRGTLTTFASPPAVAKGTKYAIVWDNVDAAPGTNYVSVNYGGLMGAAPWTTPRSPRFPALECMVWLDQGGGNSWEDPFGAAGYPLLPIFDVAFADGTHHGVGYVLSDVSVTASMTDVKWVRQSMTPTGTLPVKVTDAYIRLRRTSGTDPLIVRIERADGSLVAATTVAAADIAIGAPDPSSTASTWAHAVFPEVWLTPGTLYYLVLKGSAATTYTLVPLWKGTATSYSTATFFNDGKAQTTANSGGSWADFAVNSGNCDLQFYLWSAS